MNACVTGPERTQAERLLAELHEIRHVLDSRAQDFVDWMWRRRHIHWPRPWVNRLDAINAGLPAALNRRPA